jgi:hypothetical protein
MKYAGSIKGPPDLSSRKGFSVVAPKIEAEPTEKMNRKKSRQAASLR